MTNRTTLAAASFAVAIAGAFACGSPARAAETLAMASCASGYHSDIFGNCEPNTQTREESLCQRGFYYQSFPNGNGYRCMQDGY